MLKSSKILTMNIFIVGPMGSGKSTVGKIISDELFMNFFDTDEEIETRTGASIDWIFDLEGEEGFRKRESAILTEMVEKNSIVLSTGGGIILSEENRELLSSRGTVFYLSTPIYVQIERTAKDKDRPLLKDGDPEEILTKLHNNRQNLYLNVSSKSENILITKAKKEKNLKIIRIDNSSKKYFIKKISPYKKLHKVTLSINKKKVNIVTDAIVMHRLNNLLFCLAFYNENSLNIKSVLNRFKFLKPVEGRGLVHKISLNKKKINIIDESYNANPDTMLQSIKNLENIKVKNNKKIIILGTMNELGNNSYKIHYKLLQQLDVTIFKFVILCGEFFELSVKNLNPNNEFIHFKNTNKIMQFLKEKVHNNDIILIKCSNSTKINKFAKILLKQVSI